MKIVRLFLSIVAVTMVTSCASIKRNPVPLSEITSATVPGHDRTIRAWAHKFNKDFQDDALQSVLDEQRRIREGKQVTHSRDVLIISGGGDVGAFGAGFLAGWTHSGNRPRFKLVTGISTGALISTFAFLGSKYDGHLREFYTNIEEADVFSRYSALEAANKEALSSTAPLKKLIKENITEELLNEVAEEYKKGRRLYVGTTHFDAQRLMIWNMGAIAASNDPNRKELYEQVLLASSSIPILFPPVYINVEVNGKVYDEMHVDGGAVSQFFLFGKALNAAELRTKAGIPSDKDDRQTRLYILRNGHMESGAMHVPPKLGAIGIRTIDTLIQVTALGDLYRVYLKAKELNVDFNYVGLPQEYEFLAKERFDKVDMRRMYDVGLELGARKNPWLKEPPEFLGDGGKMHISKRSISK